VDTHGGPASGGRLVGRDGTPLDLDGFKTTIDVYLTGVFNVMRLAAGAMARQEPLDGARGVIVNTASIAAYEGQIGQLPYAAAYRPSCRASARTSYCRPHGQRDYSVTLAAQRDCSVTLAGRLMR
jgi:NAD(P)-dependent dehydrogenase (short-subunit alcohol dehydrogenase family)